MLNTATTDKKNLGLLALAWPIFVEQALHISTGVVDTVMVSHISDNAVAALGAALQIVVLCLIIFSFFAIGASVVITHHLGANDREGADQIASTAIAVNTWLGVVVSLAVWFFAEPMLRMMQLSDELMVYALPFLHLMGGTLFLESMNFSLSAVLRSHILPVGHHGLRRLAARHVFWLWPDRRLDRLHPG